MRALLWRQDGTRYHTGSAMTEANTSSGLVSLVVVASQITSLSLVPYRLRYHVLCEARGN